MRIIIVDDDPGTRNALNAYLVSTGHDVLMARDGAQALHLVKSSIKKVQPVDILVTDLKMDGMDGLELIQEIRKVDPKLPVILMTAYGDKWVQERAAGLGVCGYLDKPFRPESLTRELYAVTSRGGYVGTRL